MAKQKKKGIDVINKLRESSIKNTEKESKQEPENKPIPSFDGEKKTPNEVAETLGFCAATIRSWCKKGKLDYIKVKNRYFVCINEKYNALVQSDKVQKKIALKTLISENEALKKRINDLLLQIQGGQKYIQNFTDNNFVANNQLSI